MPLMEADDAAMQAYLGNSKKLYAHFFMEAIPDEQESQKQGRPCYKEVPFIRIMVPGDQLNVVVREIREVDKEAYPAQWEAFQRKQEQPVAGTPLNKIPFLSKARVLEFEAMGLRTAEHVRDMSDSIAQKFMDGHGLRKRISDFLKAAEGAAPMEKLQADLAERDEKIAALMKALESQGEKIEQLTKAQRR